MIGYAALLLGLGYGGYKAVTWLKGRASTPEPTSPCAGARDVCPTNINTTSPTNEPPKAGVASALDYQWCVVVQEKDTAGMIAKRVTGDARRYLELLASNPKKPRKIDPATGEINFQEICTKPTPERLVFPGSWAPWIDQLGTPRGELTPFPPYDKMPPYPVAPNTITEGKRPTPDRKGWA